MEEVTNVMKNSALPQTFTDPQDFYPQIGTSLLHAVAFGRANFENVLRFIVKCALTTEGKAKGSIDERRCLWKHPLETRSPTEGNWHNLPNLNVRVTTTADCALHYHHMAHHAGQANQGWTHSASKQWLRTLCCVGVITPSPLVILKVAESGSYPDPSMK
jgi:hypothetical protein